MSENLFSLFKRLAAGSPLLAGDVISIDGDLATIELPDGARVQARGTASLGARVFVRAGVIESGAPALPLVLIDI